MPTDDELIDQALGHARDADEQTAGAVEDAEDDVRDTDCRHREGEGSGDPDREHS